MSESKRLLIRLGLSLAFGLCVAWVPLGLAVGGARSRDIWFRRSATRASFKGIDRALHQHFKQHKRFPAQLKTVSPSPLDGWGRPFLYSVRANKPLVESLGRDGVRGGIGMDADLSNQNPKPAASHVPFLARIVEPDALQMSLVAVLCGSIAGVLFFAGSKEQKFAPRTWPLFGTCVLLAFALAAFGASFITLMHTPSGH